MDREKSRNRDDGTFSPDTGVPRFEGQCRQVLDLRRRERSNATWPGEPRYEGQAKTRRQCSEQPGVSRVRYTEVDRHNSPDEEYRERRILQSRSREERSLRTPVRHVRSRSPSAESSRRFNVRHRSPSTHRREAEKNRRSRSRYERKRSRSLSRDSDKLRPPNPKQTKSTNSTDIILDKFLSILQTVKSSDRSKLTFNTNIVPEFDPMAKEQTVLTWLTKVEECAEIYGWEDREIIHYALPKLSGVARSWYQNLPTMMFTWPEWKKKLIESFPVREDYAELLTEMLAKKVKYGESLEHYYYAKINMLNRCKIYGRQAVDCLLFAVEDRAIKVGAQAAQFSEPEQVLKYFRTVKVGHSRENYDSNKSRNDRKSVNAIKPNSMKMTCYNCDQTGHPSFRCDKPPAKCTTCDKTGHLSAHCFKNKHINKDREKVFSQDKNKNEKQVAQLNLAQDLTAKYMFDIKINDNDIDCHLDLESQCSLIKLTKAKELNLDIAVPEDLPVLRGIGANLISPVGMTMVSVEVQGIKKTINLYVVDDYVINQSVLLGHSFTEKPDIIITKTPTAVIFKKIQNIKMQLVTSKNVEIPSNTLRAVPVIANPKEDARVYVDGSVRGPVGKEYYLLPGEYEVKKGISALLIHNASPSLITLEKGTLLTRVQYKDNWTSKDLLESCNVTFCESQKSDVLNCNDKLKEEERLKLQQLIGKYSHCFSNGLHDLGFTDLTEMVIELEDNEPVVYRPYRMSYADRALVRNMVQEMSDHGIVRESTSPYASPIVLV